MNYSITYESHLGEDGMYIFPASENGYLKIGMIGHYWRHLEEDSSDEAVSSKLEKVDKEVVNSIKTDYKLLPHKSLQNYKKFVRQFLPDIYVSGAKIEFSKLCFSAVDKKNGLPVDFAKSRQEYYNYDVEAVLKL